MYLTLGTTSTKVDVSPYRDCDWWKWLVTIINCTLLWIEITHILFQTKQIFNQYIDCNTITIFARNIHVPCVKSQGARTWQPHSILESMFMSHFIPKAPFFLIIIYVIITLNYITLHQKHITPIGVICFWLHYITLYYFTSTSYTTLLLHANTLLILNTRK